MNKLQDYVHQHLSREFEQVKKRGIINEILNIEEQTLVYKYTEDGYEYLNEKLRLSEGKEFSEFGKHLDKTLTKLPNYEDIVYRAVDLTLGELKKYLDANANNAILVEHSFISASKSKAIAYQFGKLCQFRIFSRTGKEIEHFAKYGLHHPQNEKEILFRPNTKFRVLEITNQNQSTLITLEESR